MLSKKDYFEGLLFGLTMLLGFFTIRILSYLA